jgi:hypothetical protein
LKSDPEFEEVLRVLTTEVAEHYAQKAMDYMFWDIPADPDDYC